MFVCLFFGGEGQGQIFLFCFVVVFLKIGHLRIGDDTAVKIVIAYTDLSDLVTM